MTSRSDATPGFRRDSEKSEDQDCFFMEYHGREYRIYRTPTQRNWQIRIQKDNKDVQRSLGSPIREIARKQARTILDALLTTTWEDKLGDLRHRGKAQSTVGQLLDIYKLHAPVEIHISKKAADGNANRLRKVLEALFPDSDVREMKAGVITDTLFRDFIKLQVKQKVSNASIRSSIAQARSVLSTKMAHIYQARLLLPDKFIGNRFSNNLPTDGDSEAFVPIPPTAVKEMESAAADPSLDPNIRRTYLLMARFGLRNVEALFCRRSWFESHNGRRLLVLKDRPKEGFKLKNHLPGAIEVSDSLWQQLTHDLPEEAVWIIDKEAKTARHIITYRGINSFVRKFLPDRQKAAYELRKWAGSIVVTRTRSIYAAQQFLRHKTVTTTEKYYATYLKTIGAVSSEDLSAIYTVPAVTPE